ncbi:hypothetical protein ASO20_02205 [Mycoplasma sp. (ex Biomphalaria glabrata)]|uniref:hypothetical protein n=1 Tax=Mycoplasma sp. (ex Biomphalaria glabrata) TaxID=1749074 RepID=UPI00073A755A|nr:hypothetical protein [Mycoplasma sp. (ex Biomphalaria glabrata)]ALV23451.1 hypothetical protein ASO20_02205 [Mycoplasma sp. (ex Biomphalaria glabrata)]
MKKDYTENIYTEIISPIKGKVTENKEVNSSFTVEKIVRNTNGKSPFTSLDDYWNKRKIHEKKEAYKESFKQEYKTLNDKVRLSKTDTSEWFEDDYSFLGKK